MRNYRFLILLAIGAACLGSVHNSQLLAAGSPSSQSETASAPQIVTAAGVDAEYNRYMDKGYQAAERQDYRKALDSFKKALQERPSDLYARQAVQNLQAYLDRDNQFWLLLVLATVAAFGLGTAFFLFLRLRRRLPIPKSLTEQEVLLEATETDLPSETWEVNNHQETAIKEAKSLVGINPQQETAEPSLGVQSIIRLHDLDQIQTLIGDLRDLDPKKRRKAIWELAQKSDSRAMKPLVDLMIDTDSQERSLILEALSQISTRTLKPMNQALVISLQDKNPQVRKNAIRDLTRIYDVMSQISQMLCHAIDDGDSEVKETAKWALTQINLQMLPRLEVVSPTPSVPADSQMPTVSVEDL